MKKILSIIFLFSFLFAAAQNIPPKPNPPRLVNDLAHVLTTDQVAALESKLVAYDDSTSIQIAIVTVPSTGDYAIEDYALKILRDWGVGNKKTNNGLVILAAIQDRKVYIATGYGMEGSVPDITAKEIIDNEIVPNFKAGSYYNGLNNAADAIIKASRGEYKAPKGYANRGNKSIPAGGVLAIIFIIFILVLIISRGGGSGGGGLYNRSGFLPWIIANMISNSGRSGGGWSGGGGGWSGGGGGGGFGGFGGGSGGGGGAGGSW
ncbi:MAG: TPM domain-containing protein [Bacteroidetes bacterium]|nr:TPM domain-containing protein [Bacteroidota bacterium]MBS1933157.1 TPM domain-containing protein [Bacteroidota bacterium]